MHIIKKKMKTLIVITILMASVLSIDNLVSNPSIQLTTLPLPDVSIEEAKAVISNGKIQGILKSANKCKNEVIELTQIFKNTFIAPCSNLLAFIKCDRNEKGEAYCYSGSFLSYRMGYE